VLWSGLHAVASKCKVDTDMRGSLEILLWWPAQFLRIHSYAVLPLTSPSRIWLSTGSGRKPGAINGSPWWPYRDGPIPQERHGAGLMIRINNHRPTHELHQAAQHLHKDCPLAVPLDRALLPNPHRPRSQLIRPGTFRTTQKCWLSQDTDMFAELIGAAAWPRCPQQQEWNLTSRMVGIASAHKR